MEPMLSIVGFCKLAGISRSSYYNLKAIGEGPRETPIGTRRLIAKDTAEAWLRSREVPTEEGKAA